MKRVNRGLAACALLSLFLGGCTSGDPDAPKTPGAGPPTASSGSRPPAGELFVDRTAELGIDFVHFNGMSGEFYFSEMVGPGGAFVDYDRDGDLDVYIVQGHMLGPGKTLADAKFPPRAPLPLRDRLYRNRLVETGTLSFEDVTDAAGIDSRGYGMGVACGDADGDGWVDLYITNYEENLFLHNNGDGTFSDGTELAGLQDDRWSTSAAFVDYDRDGDLDLFVCNYVDFTFATHKECFSETSARDYCGPLSYSSYPDRLFRNQLVETGTLSFEDVTADSQIARAYGAGLGVVCADLDGDDWVDIYVANDGMANQFWINQKDGTFRDEALIAGCALNEEGRPEASMGIDAADFDGDGDEDLFMTHLRNETNTLYLNDGQGMFEDYSFETGLGKASRTYTGFGTVWFDFDNDLWLDLIIANGAVTTLEPLARAGDPFPLHEPNLIFRNLGNGKFADITAEAGKVFELSEVSRGTAAGDVDNDGDTDVLILNNNGPARLLLNEVGNRNPWVGLRVLERDGVNPAIGARVEILLPDGGSLWRSVRVAASYCSSNDPRLVVGLGPHDSIRGVRVHWPDGRTEAWGSLSPRSWHSLTRGEGEEVD